MPFLGWMMREYGNKGFFVIFFAYKTERSQRLKIKQNTIFLKNIAPAFRGGF